MPAGSRPPRGGTMLTPADLAAYRRDGFMVLPDILSAREIEALRRVTDDFVAAASRITANDDIYDLEDSHAPGEPRVRRIKTPHLHHPVYAEAARHPAIVAVLRDLWGSVRFDTGKLNMKSAGYGAPVEWHQDWAFYPHTNDDLAAVGIMLDGCDADNGPMMVLPGSHLGPIYDHHGPTEARHRRRQVKPAGFDVDRAAEACVRAVMVVGRPQMAAGKHHHRSVVRVAAVEHDADRGQIVVGVRVEGPVLVPFDGRPIAGRFHIELAGVKPDRTPQIPEHRDDCRVTGGLGIDRVMQVRRLDAAHPRLPRRVRIFEIIDVVIGRDAACRGDEIVSHAPQSLDLARGEDVGQHHEPVASIGGKIGWRQHCPSTRRPRSGRHCSPSHDSLSTADRSRPLAPQAAHGHGDAAAGAGCGPARPRSGLPREPRVASCRVSGGHRAITAQGRRPVDYRQLSFC